MDTNWFAFTVTLSTMLFVTVRSATIPSKSLEYGLGLDQWEKTLHYNVVSHWLSPYPALLWLHNGRDGVSNHQPHDCLLNCLFKRRSKKTSKCRVTGLCAMGNSPMTGEFPAQMDSNAENVSIWWRHHGMISGIEMASEFNTSGLEQNGQYFGGDICKCMFLKDNFCIFSYIPMGPIGNKPSLVLVMARCRIGMLLFKFRLVCLYSSL